MSDEKEIPKIVQAARAALLAAVRKALKPSILPGSKLSGGHEAALCMFGLALEGAREPDLDAMGAIAHSLSPLERREACALLSLLEQLAHPTLGLLLKVALDAKDNFVIPMPDGSGTHIYLGDGDPEPEEIERRQAEELPEGLAEALQEMLQATAPPGMDVQVVGAGSLAELMEKANEFAKNLGREDREDFAADDPISQIARRLDRMPGSKRPKLAPKKLPEC